MCVRVWWCVQSSVLKREVSTRTLGRLVGSTRYVIKPYLRYPRWDRRTCTSKAARRQQALRPQEA
jgi:hypothetical protein